MPVLGIDVGTQSLKAVVVSDAMKLLGSGSVSYQSTFPRSGWAEQDPTLWLQALAPAIESALGQAGLRPAAIAGICLCGQLDGCIPTDAQGAAIGPAIIWMDRRAASLLSDIELHHGQTDAAHVWLQQASRLADATGERAYNQMLAKRLAALSVQSV